MKKGVWSEEYWMWWGVWPTETVALTHRRLWNSAGEGLWVELRGGAWLCMSPTVWGWPSLITCLGLTWLHGMMVGEPVVSGWILCLPFNGCRERWRCDAKGLMAAALLAVNTLNYFFQSHVIIIINYPVHLLLILFISFFLQNECIISGPPELDHEEFTPSIGEMDEYLNDEWIYSTFPIVMGLLCWLSW